MFRYAMIFALVICSLNSGAAQVNDDVTLTVHVDGPITAKGTLQLEIYTTKGDWLEKASRVLRIDLTQSKERSFKVEGLKPGPYAMVVIQDENNNDNLDMGMMGPEELYGFSNDAKGMFGPPSFDDARIEILEDRTIKIKL